MPNDSEAFASVRAQLCIALDRIEHDLPRLTAGDIITRVAALRAQARPHGLAPLDRVAHGCEQALARSGRGALVRLYLGSMRDALGCQRADAAAGDALLATIAARMAG